MKHKVPFSICKNIRMNTVDHNLRLQIEGIVLNLGDEQSLLQLFYMYYDKPYFPCKYRCSCSSFTAKLCMWDMWQGCEIFRSRLGTRKLLKTTQQHTHYLWLCPLYLSWLQYTPIHDGLLSYQFCIYHSFTQLKIHYSIQTRTSVSKSGNR